MEKPHDVSEDRLVRRAVISHFLPKDCFAFHSGHSLPSFFGTDLTVAEAQKFSRTDPLLYFGLSCHFRNWVVLST